MAEILCIRHGQASFATDDYDQLSPVGLRQARLLGEHLVRQGTKFDRLYTGTLKRQQQTAEAVVAVYREHNLAMPEIRIDQRWNELENDRQIESLAPFLAEQDSSIESLLEEAHRDKKAFQKIIRATFNYWINEQPDLPELESWPEAQARVVDALNEVRADNGSGTRAAVFSSGGIIAVLAAEVLGVPASGVYALFEQVINTSITKLVHSGEQISLSSFNEHAYLQGIATAFDEEGMVTFR